MSASHPLIAAAGEKGRLPAGCSINFFLHRFSFAGNNSGDEWSSAHFSSASSSCISFEQQTECTKPRRLEVTVADFENWHLMLKLCG